MRGSSLDAGRRAYLGVARGTVSASDDTQMMQTVDVRVSQDELLPGVERFQTYGHTSVPRDPDGSDGNSKAAEVTLGFVNGNRSHPIVLAMDDRRYRPTGWQKGDSGLWHYNGNTAKFTDTGWQQTHADKQPWTITVGSSTLTVADGKITATVGGTSVTIQDGRVDLGGLGGSAVLTVAGPSSKVFAVI